MKIYTYNCGRLKSEKSLMEALSLSERNVVISAAGAGGKTSTILRLEQEYKERMQPVIITTTTHMMVPETSFLYDDEEEEEFWEKLKEGKSVWAGRKSSKDKFTCPGENFFQRILGSGLPVLIEADGAKRKSVKAPREHEPVIPKETAVVLYVFGMDAVGKRIKEGCCRPEVVCRILGKGMESRLTCEDIAALALNREGGQKGVCDGMDYHVILNKTENEERMAYGMETAEYITRHSDVVCHLTSYV